MDTVGRRLNEVTAKLGSLKVHFEVVVTSPRNRRFLTDTDCLYVIRQHIDADGIYHLIAAGKMGKEVLNNGI